MRTSGVLLHITSLPTPWGIGDFGPSAFRFADSLHTAGQRYWQVLPLTPVELFYDGSPYHSVSAFAGNPLFISPERLIDEGFLPADALADAPAFPADTLDLGAVIPFKMRLLDEAVTRFGAVDTHGDFDRFRDRTAWWLDEYALFTALRRRHVNTPWFEWPDELKYRDPAALDAARVELAADIRRETIIQYLFDRQWTALKSYCNERGVFIFGDMPIYVDHDSADCWADRGIFKLDDNCRPWVVAGVPPDYFSTTGQLWGNPVYNWDALRERGFDWWVRRVRRNLELFDLVRIDHFRGLVAFWEVPAHETTAVNGHWVEVPAEDLFTALARLRPLMPIIAEDLGLITPDVREIMTRFGFPGMRVLQFAFGGPVGRHPYIPHNVPERCVYYTGTHDNNTVRGFYESEASPDQRQRIQDYIGHDLAPDTAAWELVRLVMQSAAETAIVPLQDILNLGAAARMNIPGTANGNWRWRTPDGAPDAATVERLRDMTKRYGRS